MPDRPDRPDYTDPYPDEKRDELIARFNILYSDEDAYTWLDNDPDVAWEREPHESYHGALKALLMEAGWESCYHRDGARLHYNVKLNRMGAWMGARDALDKAHVLLDARERIEEIVNGQVDMELEVFWQDWLPGFVKYDLKVDASPYSCGRSAGYVNVPKMESDGENMIRLAQFLERSRQGYDSREYGEELAKDAIEEDQQRQLAEMASPRIERIEA